MARELLFKPDFPLTAERFGAWWNRHTIDRPPVSVRVRPRRAPAVIVPPASVRERWTRIGYVIDSAIAVMEATDYVGDSFPAFCPTLGPDVMATVLGGDLSFEADATCTHPFIHDTADWNRLIRSQPRFHNLYWRALEELTAAAVEASEDRFIVGINDLLGPFDALAAIRDPEMLRVDIIQSPETIRRAARQATRAFVSAYERLYSEIAVAGSGTTSWTPAYHAGPMYALRCEFWSDAPSAMVRDLMLSKLAFATASLERSILQVRGVGALRHLEMLLELPQIHAIQWQYGPGNGPAMRWVDIYRRCLAAGKAVQVIAVDPADALATLHALGPDGVWLWVDQPFGSVDLATSFIDDVASQSRVARPAHA